jgi:hypothetical protein
MAKKPDEAPPDDASTHSASSGGAASGAASLPGDGLAPAAGSVIPKGTSDGITDDMCLWYQRPDADRLAGLTFKGCPLFSMRRPVTAKRFRAAFSGVEIRPLLQHTLRLAVKLDKAPGKSKEAMEKLAEQRKAGIVYAAFELPVRRDAKPGTEPVVEHYMMQALGAMPRADGGIR